MTRSGPAVSQAQAHERAPRVPAEGCVRASAFPEWLIWHFPGTRNSLPAHTYRFVNKP